MVKNIMQNTLVLLWQICLLRLGPQDLPYSKPQCAAVVLLSLLFNAIAVLLIGGHFIVLLYLPLLVALYVGFVWALLAFKHQTERFVQTVTALRGTDAILSALSLPVVLLQVLVPGLPAILLQILWLILVIWTLSVTGHILKNALNVSMLMGVALAITLMLLVNSLLNLIL